MSKFKVGDKVKLIKSWRHKNLHGVDSKFLKTIDGDEFIVEKTDVGGCKSIQIDCWGSFFYFPAEIFQKVKSSSTNTDTKQKFNLGDKVRLVNDYKDRLTYGIPLSELDKLKDKILTVKFINKFVEWDGFYAVNIKEDSVFTFSSDLFEKVEDEKNKKVGLVDKDLMELYKSKIKLFHEGCIVRIDSTNTYGIVEKILPGSFLIKIPSVLTTRFVEYKLSDLTILS